MLGKISWLGRRVWNCCRLLVKESVFADSLPRMPRQDDLFLVEFPKSGVTWLSFLLANVHLLESGIRREVNFYNIHDLVPDINQTRFLAPDPLPFPGFRVIKSHASYNPFYQKVIYLVRHPLEVMVSYYNFQIQLGAYGGDFGQFIQDRTFGLPAWQDHVRSWFSSPANLSFVYVRYEDLLEDTPGQLERIYQQLGLRPAGQSISQAMEKSTLSNMLRLEKEYAHGRRPHLQGFRFVGKKGKALAKEEVSSAHRELIASYLTGLEFLGYDS